MCEIVNVSLNRRALFFARGRLLFDRWLIYCCEATENRAETEKILQNLIEARAVCKQIMPNRLDETEPRRK